MPPPKSKLETTLNASLGPLFAGFVIVLVVLAAFGIMVRGCQGAGEDGPDVDGVRSVN